MDIEVESVAAATAVIGIVVKRKKKNRKKTFSLGKTLAYQKNGIWSLLKLVK